MLSPASVRAGTVVAVKVRHPGVTLLMQRDVVLMHRAAALSARLPGLAALRLDESVRQFGAPLREQARPNPLWYTAKGRTTVWLIPDREGCSAGAHSVL